MSELDDILAQYDYAEEITVPVADGKLNVTLTEAHAGRNREFGRAILEAAEGKKIEKPSDFPEDLEIKVFCEILLKGWDLTRDGQTVPISAAHDILTAGRSGVLLFREMATIAATPARFLKGDTKKKTSSDTTPTASSSETKPSSSKNKRKPADTQSPPASSDT